MRLRYVALIPAAAIALLIGCIFDDKQSGRSSVVENEVLAGTLFAENGEPVHDAEVKIIRVDHVPNKGLVKVADSAFVFTFRTDSAGRYYPKGVPAGEYNILGGKGGGLSFRDSVAITAETDSLPSDTLAEPGTVVGTVELEPNHDPRTVFLQVLGTNYFAAADSAGRFAFEGIAHGQYALRVVTTLPNYTPWFGSIPVRSGKRDTLAQSIRLSFTGIPVVRGLKVAYDTATMTARISWSPARFAFLKEYEITRNTKGAVESPLAIGRTMDTSFVDSLVSFSAGNQGSVKEYEYQVRLRNQSAEVGLSFESVSVKALPTSAVRTTLELRFLNASNGRYSILDTAIVAVAWLNPTRMQDSLYWLRGADSSVLMALKISGREGLDTLKVQVGSKAGRFGMLVRIKDVAGSYWVGADGVDVVLDAPQANAGRDTSLGINDVVNLHGRGSDSIGKIVKWEWDIGGIGTFHQTSMGDTSIRAGATTGRMMNILRVTDDDGLSALDTMEAEIILDAPILTLASETTATVSDTIRLTAKAVDGDSATLKWAWDIGNTGTFTPTRGSDTSIIALSTPGFVTSRVRVTDEDGNESIKTTVTRFINDFPMVNLDIIPRHLASGGGYTLRAKASDLGRIVQYEWDLGKTGSFVIGSKDTAFVPTAAMGLTYSVSVRAKDEDGNVSQADLNSPISKWMRSEIPLEAIMPGYSVESSVALDGRIYFSAYSGSPSDVSRVFAFDPASGILNALPWLLIPRKNLRIATVNGKLYACGGYQGGRDGLPWNSSNAVEEFDPGAGVWVTKAESPISGQQSVVGAEGSLYLLGGMSVWKSYTANNSWLEKRFTGTETNDMEIINYRGAAVSGGTIYAQAYNLNDSYRRTPYLLQYETGSEKWTTMSVFAWNNVGLGMVIANGNPYVVGFQGQSETVQVFDKAANKWLEKSPLLFPGFTAAAVELGGKIYVISKSNILQVYDPALEP